MSDTTVIPATILQSLRLERHGFTFRNRPVDLPALDRSKPWSSWFSQSTVRRRDVDWLNEGVKQLIENHGAAFVIDQLKAACLSG
jgi:hypothetical protein